MNIQIPVKSDLFNEKTCSEYVDILKRIKAYRVNLIVNPLSSSGRDINESLVWKREYLEKNGFETGIWFGETFGHGISLSGVNGSDVLQPRFTELKGINGETGENCFCPLDGNFKKFFISNVLKAASLGFKLILFDDDFRLSNRGYGVGCACGLHRKRMARILGDKEAETCSYETLSQRVFGEKPNSWRRAWLKAQGDSIREFAVDIRNALDSEYPDVRIGNCVGSTVWNLDGVYIYEISKILAGKNNKPYMRLCGGAYWSNARNPDIPGLFEVNSLHMSYLKERNECEIMAEDDPYPRPKQNCPACFGEICEAFWHAEGTYGSVYNYLFDFNSAPNYEKGYFRSFEKRLPIYEKYANYFSGRRTGVRVYEYLNRIENAEFDYPDFEVREVNEIPHPFAGQMLANSCIPTVYNGDGICGICFQDNAKYLNRKDIGKGLILDGMSAKILSERGIDVGLQARGFSEKKTINLEYYTEPEDYASVIGSRARLLECDISAEAEIQSRDENGNVLSYFYEGNDGRFLVFLFDTTAMSRNCNLLFTYYRTRQLLNAIERISGTEIPVALNGFPFVYQLNRIDGDVLTVGIFNGFYDSITDPVFEISDDWKLSDCLDCDAELKNGKLIIKDEIPAFRHIAFKLKKCNYPTN